MSTFSIVGLEEHDAALRAALFENQGIEGAAYVLFREAQIESDPWDRRRHTKLLVREVIPIVPVSASGVHITWDTGSYVALLQRTASEDLILGIAHCHPGGLDAFSVQDDENEAELLRTACNRNGRETKLVSILFAAEGAPRVWQCPKHQTPVRSVTFIGERIQFHHPSTAPGSPVFARQMLAFGPALTRQLKNLRVGVVGAGGTGSATAVLLARAGVGQLLVVDEDIVETTNLNRLHGATQADADAMRPKAEIVAGEIARMALGIRVIALRGWASSPALRAELKACDVIFLLH